MLSIVRKNSLMSDSQEENKKILIEDLKKNVKSLMELMALRKLVNEDSGVVHMLCLSVEACVKHGLKRRPFSSADSCYVDLLGKLDQLGCASAAFVSSRLRAWSKSKSPTAPSFVNSPVKRMFSFGATPREVNSTNDLKSRASRTFSTDSYNERLLWIRIALVDKHLLQILTSLVANASSLYQCNALFADPVYGPLIPALLAGPCSVDYSHLRGSDIPSYCDTTVDDLLNRRKSTVNAAKVAHIRQKLLARNRHFSIAAVDLLSSTVSDDPLTNTTSESDFVFTAGGLSLPGSRVPELIFAKNNVSMEPYAGSVPLPGYLVVFISNAPGDNGTAVIRWTPNTIMKSSSESSPVLSKRAPNTVTVYLADISHIHCHMRPHSDSHATVVFIGKDGIQFPAMVFTQAASALALLEALAGVIPADTHLEPPILSHEFESDLKMRDLVFQIVPQAPVLAEFNIGGGLSKVSEDGLGQCDSGTVASIAENIKSIDSGSPETLSLSAIKSSRTENDFNQTSGPSLPINIPSSNSFSGGLTLTLEAALSAVTTAGAQYFSEIGSENAANVSSGNGGSKGVGRLSFVCRSVQRQLLARAFYGWLAYVRHVKTVRTQLTALVTDSGQDKSLRSFDDTDDLTSLIESSKLDADIFARLQNLCNEQPQLANTLLHRIIYFNGIGDTSLRCHVWAVLLGAVNLGVSEDVWKETWKQKAKEYADVCLKWQEAEQQAELAARSSLLTEELTPPVVGTVLSAEGDKESVFNGENVANKTNQKTTTKKKVVFTFSNVSEAANSNADDERQLRRSVSDSCEVCDSVIGDNRSCNRRLSDSALDISIQPTIDFKNPTSCLKMSNNQEETATTPDSATLNSESIGIYSSWLINLHRIDKDVARCDRSLEFFRPGDNQENLSALRRVVCSFVWENMEIGYIQGMCDIAAPLLVICKSVGEEMFEAMTYTLFTKLMGRLGVNFPTGSTRPCGGPAAIDVALSRLRSLIQILDPELYEHLSDSSSELDATHLYFAYRWLLLDFKREFSYKNVFCIWETIWAADDVASLSFSLFVAFALIETYRDVIVTENMDFTDIIKFFNDTAERHDVVRVLDLARQLVRRVQETSHLGGPRSP